MKIKPFFQQRPAIHGNHGQHIFAPPINQENGPGMLQQYAMRQSSVPLKQQTFNIQPPFPQQNSIPAQRPIIKFQSQRQSIMLQETYSNRKPAQSYIYNEQKPIDIDSRGEIDKKNIELKQCQGIIRKQNEQLAMLQSEAAQKILDFEQLQSKNTDMLREFKLEFKSHLETFNSSLGEDDFTKLLFIELDRKAINLQNNVNDNIKIIKNVVQSQQYKMEQLCQNFSSNINQRMGEDEDHFKGELDIMRQKLNMKIDKQSVVDTIAHHIAQFRADLDVQLDQLKQQNQLTQNQNKDESNVIKNQMLQKISKLESNLTNQLHTLQKNLVSNLDNAEKDTNEKKQLQKEIALLKSKFTQVQKTFLQIQKQCDTRMSQYKTTNLNLSKQSETQLEEIKYQKTQIALLEQQIQNLNTITIKSKVVSPIQVKKVFVDKSYFSGTSMSTKPEQIQQVEKKLQIDLDDFADFNEDSLIDSVQSAGSNNCEFFYPQQTNPFNRGYQADSPPKNTIPKSIGTLKSKNDVKQQIKEMTSQTSKSNHYNEILKCIKRRMLYINNTTQPLQCTYSKEGYLVDLETNLQVLDELGQPLRVSEQQKQKLTDDKQITVQ